MSNKKSLAVIITGCGYKPIQHIYKYKGVPSHAVIPINNKLCKMNIGTASAYYLAKKGIEVIMVSKTGKKLKNIKDGLIKLGCDNKLISYVATDATSDKKITQFIKKLPKNRNFFWLQSLGVGGGTYKIPNDNIYLPLQKIDTRVMETEMGIVTATHKLMLKLLPILKKQVKYGVNARICIITSMSGERGYHYGGTHVAAKHALVGYIKGIKNELEDVGIDIIDIRPGAIDTGMYDNLAVRKTVEDISVKTKMWGGRKPIYSSPIMVAKVVYNALFSTSPKKVYKILAPHQK